MVNKDYQYERMV